MMVDLHTHILPGMDDGSRNVQESLWMLDALAGQGISVVAATSHFYATREHPESFLSRRAESAASLAPFLKSTHPAIRLGAEVHFFDGISQASGMEQLCIEGTPLFLLEMTGGIWSGSMVDEVLELCQKRKLSVVLAHIERYYAHQPKKIWERLEQAGVLFQVNAEPLFRRFGSGRALRLVREEKVHFLGSDCHNQTSRTPCLAPARAQIVRKLGEEALHRLDKIQDEWFFDPQTRK